jgi:hypothetical protein
MKKTAATKRKATKKPATAAPAQEAVTAASQAKEATRPARKAKAAKPAAKKADELISGEMPEIKTAKKVAPAATKVEAKAPSKKDQVLALISRKNGASLDEIMTATSWQKHTVRGFISLLGKAGTKVESSKSEAGARTYKAA